MSNANATIVATALLAMMTAPWVVATPPAGTSESPSLSEQGQQWQAHLSGVRLQQFDRYASSGTDIAVGGTFERTMDVCSDGRFFYRDSSSVYGAGTGISGHAGGRHFDTGSWRIIEQGQLVGVEFRWQDGSVTQHLLEHDGQSMYIDRTRTFRTFQNASCP